VLITSDPDEHVAYLQHFIDLGFGEIYVHNVGRDQEPFITFYGENVIPRLRWPA
jgi:coenzyme F420-dependent glucose-6-phosphate dehydrogenase